MNLQLDHFSDVQKYLKPIEGDLSGVRFSQTNSNLLFCRSTPVEHGSHNVSRWMTWLPISLKNAAKCDKWYQLQNHSITESLNANGAREKPFMGHPRACRILSVEHVYKKRKKLNARVLCSYGRDLSSFPIFFGKAKGGAAREGAASLRF